MSLVSRTIEYGAFPFVIECCVCRTPQVEWIKCYSSILDARSRSKAVLTLGLDSQNDKIDPLPVLWLKMKASAKETFRLTFKGIWRETEVEIRGKKTDLPISQNENMLLAVLIVLGCIWKTFRHYRLIYLFLYSRCVFSAVCDPRWYWFSAMVTSLIAALVEVACLVFPSLTKSGLYQ